MALAILPARAQTTAGSVEGVVTDAQGGTVPNAKVRLLNTSTALELNATTDGTGAFHFPVVAVGTYEVTIEASGMAKYVRKGVVVTVGAKLSLPVELALATQSITVTVTSEAPILETTRSGQASTVNDTFIANLPVNGRNFISFALLTPGVTLDTFRGQGDLSFAGQRGTLNSLIVDGADNNNTFFGQPLARTGFHAPYQFSQDSVQEFQVNSNSYSAEYGNAGGAVINVVTKSGTNDFHGAGFWFFRDTSMNANDLINKNQRRPRSPLHFNQFGGHIGGPIVRDKAFFFFNYDGQRNTLPNFTFLNLPTGFAASDTNQQTALSYLTARAAPWSQTQNQNIYLGKIDWHISASELLTGRINSGRFTGGNFENSGPQTALEHTGASLTDTDTLTVQLTSMLGSNKVNVLRGSYLRDNEPGQANSINPEATIFQAAVPNAFGGQKVFVVGRNFFSPRFTNIHRGEWADTFTWIRGHHTWKFGGRTMVERVVNFFPGNFSGAYTIGSLEEFGCMLNGGTGCIPSTDTFSTFVQAFPDSTTTGPTSHPNFEEYSLFAQDEWRVRNDLTLNLGLRYDLDWFAQPSTVNTTALAAGINTGRINRDINNLGPRIGFAWQPRGSNRLVVRGGYGIYYGRTTGLLLATPFTNNGVNVATLKFTGSNIPNYPKTECGPPVASPSCPLPSGASSSPPIIFAFAKDYAMPYLQQASLGIEYRIERNTSFSINLLGVKGVHLTRTRDINLQGPEKPTTIGIAGTTQTVTFNKITQPRPISAFFRIEEFESNANSRYGGLVLQLNHRFSHNFQALLNYTWSKVIDDVPDATSVVPFTFDDAKMVSDPLNIRADRGPGVNDQRHRFVFSWTWDVNGYAKRLPAAAWYFLGGWEISGILTAQTGQPYSALVSADLNNDSNSRTDRAPGFGRDSFYLPNVISLDSRLTKNIKVTERAKIQLILEAFNSLNRANILQVNTTFYSLSKSAATCAPAAAPCLAKEPLFGSPTQTFGPRILQVAAKISF